MGNNIMMELKNSSNDDQGDSSFQSGKFSSFSLNLGHFTFVKLSKIIKSEAITPSTIIMEKQVKYASSHC